MDKIDEGEIKRLIHRIGLKYNLRDDIVNKILVSPYKFTREKITELELKEVVDREDAEALKTNFMYLHIRKLFISIDRLLTINKRKQKNE